MHRNGKWARQLIALQKADGSWGRFHSMSVSGGDRFTTEQALSRLLRLGFSMEDHCIRRAVSYMDDCLCGRSEIPDPREKLHNWDIFTALMLSARIRQFTPDNPAANRVAEQWAGVIEHAFSSGSYDHDRYIAAYAEAFGMNPQGGRLVDFTSFYQLSLLQGALTPAAESALMDYVLSKPDGMYYIYDHPLGQPPPFMSLAASRYMGAIEILSGYRCAPDRLDFAADWLEKNRSEAGWDMGRTARDGMYFPLSDDWRKAENRIADCTERVSRLLGKLRP